MTIRPTAYQTTTQPASVSQNEEEARRYEEYAARWEEKLRSFDAMRAEGKSYSSRKYRDYERSARKARQVAEQYRSNSYVNPVAAAQARDPGLKGRALADEARPGTAARREAMDQALTARGVSPADQRGLSPGEKRYLVSGNTSGLSTDTRRRQQTMFVARRADERLAVAQGANFNPASGSPQRVTYTTVRAEPAVDGVNFSARRDNLFTPGVPASFERREVLDERAMRDRPQYSSAFGYTPATGGRVEYFYTTEEEPKPGSVRDSFGRLKRSFTQPKSDPREAFTEFGTSTINLGSSLLYAGGEKLDALGRRTDKRYEVLSGTKSTSILDKPGTILLSYPGRFLKGVGEDYYDSPRKAAIEIPLYYVGGKFLGSGSATVLSKYPRTGKWLGLGLGAFTVADVSYVAKTEGPEGLGRMAPEFIAGGVGFKSGYRSVLPKVELLNVRPVRGEYSAGTSSRRSINRFGESVYEADILVNGKSSTVPFRVATTVSGSRQPAGVLSRRIGGVTLSQRVPGGRVYRSEILQVGEFSIGGKTYYSSGETISGVFRPRGGLFVGSSKSGTFFASELTGSKRRGVSDIGERLSAERGRSLTGQLRGELLYITGRGGEGRVAKTQSFSTRRFRFLNLGTLQASELGGPVRQASTTSVSVGLFKPSQGADLGFSNRAFALAEQYRVLPSSRVEPVAYREPFTTRMSRAFFPKRQRYTYSGLFPLIERNPRTNPGGVLEPPRPTTGYRGMTRSPFIKNIPFKPVTASFNRFSPFFGFGVGGATGSRFSFRSVQTPAQTPRRIITPEFESGFRTTQQTRQSFDISYQQGFRTNTVTRITPTIPAFTTTRVPGPETPPPPPIIGLPDLGGGRRGRGRRADSFRQRKAYTPSLFAFGTGLRGKAPGKKGLASGLSIRPITSGGFSGFS